MVLGLACSHKKIQARKKRILKIGLPEHEIHPIKVQKLLTFLINYKDQEIVSEHNYIQEIMGLKHLLELDFSIL